MRRRLAVLFLVLALMAYVMTGCGTGKSMDNSYLDTPKATPGVAASDWDSGGYRGDAPPSEAMETPMADSLVGIGNSPINTTNAILAERKMIMSANLTIEVESFDKALANIEGMVANIGFIQNSNSNTERVYVNGEMKLVKSGVIVLRVDKNSFVSVINNLNGLGEVYNYTRDGQDVTEQYFDVESRLRLLKMEQEKLEAYVAKLDDLDEIFKAESKLTEIRYQIESLTGKLNKLNSLVELSTITVNLNEKVPGYEPKPETYGDKLVNSLKQSLLDVVEFLGDLLLFIVAALPVLVFIGICVLFGMWIYKRIGKKRRNTNMRGPVTNDMPAAQMPPAPPVPPVPPAADGASVSPVSNGSPTSPVPPAQGDKQAQETKKQNGKK